MNPEYFQWLIDPSSLQVVWESLWGSNNLVGRSIIVVILFLLALAWAAAHKHRRRYRKKESGDLKKVEAKLIAWRNELQSPTQPKDDQPVDDGKQDPEGEAFVPPVVPLADLSELRLGTRPTSLIHERLAAIERMRQYHVKISVDTLQQLSIARETARPGLKLPNFAAGSAMMLGMLGTFIGLALMVQEIDLRLPLGLEDLTFESWTESIGDIRVVLGGMRTAFSTTLVGLTASILASIWGFRLRQAQAVFFERLDRFTTQELLPATVPIIEDESLLEQVSRKLEHSFSRVEELVVLNQETLRDLGGIEKSFLQIVKEIRSITKSEATRNLERVIDELARANSSILALVDHLPRVATAMEGNHQGLNSRLDKLLQSLQQFTSSPVRPAHEKAAEMFTASYSSGNRFGPALLRNIILIVLVLLAAWWVLQ